MYQKKNVKKKNHALKRKKQLLFLDHQSKSLMTIKNRMMIIQNLKLKKKKVLQIPVVILKFLLKMKKKKPLKILKKIN